MNSKNWERFTKRARQVLSLAQEEAERMNHSYIGSEHVLIGLIREEGGVAGRVLRELGLEAVRVQAMVERLTTGKSTRTPFSKTELAPSNEACFAAHEFSFSAPNAFVQCLSHWTLQHFHT